MASIDSPLPDPVVELFYAGAWHDVTADLADEGISITRGRTREGGQTDPTTVRVVLRNPTGVYSPRNPNSPLSGLIGRGTPLRVAVTYPPLAQVVRAVAGAVEWAQRWSRTGPPSAVVQITAAGPLRQLGQGASPVRSAMYRGTVGLANLVGYWPMEDQPAAGFYAAVVGRPMRITGSAVPADAEPFIASAPLPTIHRGYLAATIPAYPNTGAGQVRWLMKVPAGSPDGAIIMRVRTNSTLGWVDVLYRTGGAIEVLTYTNQNEFSAALGPIAFGVDGKLLRCSLELTQNGPNVDLVFATLEQGAISGFASGFTNPNITLGSLAAVEILPKPQFWDLGDTVLGHVAAQSAVTSLFDLASQLNAYIGETPESRITRLAGDAGAALVIVGGDGAGQRLGYQRRRTALDLMTEAADADEGILYETRTANGLAYRPHSALVAQPVGLDITYTDNLLRPLEPTDDDSGTRNTWVVTRAGGAEATVTQTSGPLGTAAIGIYDDSATLSLAVDEAARHHAGWRVGLGTIDEARWPRIGIDLADPPWLASSVLTAAALALDVGQRLRVSALPAWLPPVPIDALVHGYTEDITPYHHRIVFACSPYLPYRVGRYGTAAGQGDRWSNSTSSVAAAMTTTGTTMQVAFTAPPRWGRAADGVPLPLDVIVAGERMTVTAIAGTTSPQPFTVIRSVNGVVKTHAIGEPVGLAEPLTWGI